MIRSKRRGEADILGVLGFVFTVGVVLIFFGTTIVGVGQKAVLEQFGTVSDNVLSSGFHFKSILQGVHTMNIKQQVSEDIKMENVYNVDQQNVTVDFQVIYNLPKTDAELVSLYKNYNGNPFENFALGRIEQAIKTVTGRYNTQQIVTNSNKFKVEILEEARKNVDDIVTINDIVIPNITFDAEIEKAIREKQIAQQNAEKAKYKLVQAKIDADTAVAKAEGTAKSLQIKANAIKANPAVVRLTEIEKWNGVIPLGAKSVVLGNADVINALNPETK